MEQENTEFDALQLVRVGVPMAQLTKMFDTSSESWVLRAVDRLLFMSIAKLACFFTEKRGVENIRH